MMKEQYTDQNGKRPIGKMAKTVKSVRNGGRPKINEEDKKSEVISFRVDSLTKMAIEQKVEESKLAMGEFLRRAVKNAEITPAQYEGYFREIDNFNSARLLDLVAVSVSVVQPWSKEELKSLKDLYRFASDVNALVKRGNASLEGKSIEQINYRLELAHLQDEFTAIKDYFMKRVVCDNANEEAVVDEVNAR